MYEVPPDRPQIKYKRRSFLWTILVLSAVVAGLLLVIYLGAVIIR